MNVKNNKRHQETIENIEKTFVLLLKDNELKEISVTELCKTAGINRSTFYAKYETSCNAEWFILHICNDRF